MQTIGIDARFYGAESRGLGRYTAMLLKYLEKLDDKNRYFVYLKKENFNTYNPQKPNFVKKLADVSWYSIGEQIRMPILINTREIDLMHFPHFNIPLFYNKPYVVTIHDLILMEYSTRRATRLGPFRYRFKEFGYRTVLKKAVRSSKKIITVSKFTKKDIIKHFPDSASKIKVIYEACEFNRAEVKLKGKKGNFKAKKENFSFIKCGINKPYVLYVGGAYPHKNLENLVMAFKKVKQNKRWRALSLILVGGDDFFYQRLKKLVKQKQIEGVKFLGLIKDEKALEKIYQHAKAFVFPSFYEGFGLPPLEAMSKGTPVISSNASCMPEILGDAAYYFNPQDVLDISQRIMDALGDEKLRESLIKKGIQRVQRYSWGKTAQKTLEVYQEALQI